LESMNIDIHIERWPIERLIPSHMPPLRSETRNGSGRGRKKGESVPAGETIEAVLLATERGLRRPATLCREQREGPMERAPHEKTTAENKPTVPEGSE
jgi:hypothetical protein